MIWLLYDLGWFEFADSKLLFWYDLGTLVDVLRMGSYPVHLLVVLLVFSSSCLSFAPPLLVSFTIGFMFATDLALDHNATTA
jgi:hypothetical protein